MIISHTKRYLFIEIPLTASYAIRHELCEHYGGEPILHKHASYPEFFTSARPEELSYYVFAAVRNPLDEVVSRYFKLKTDHRGGFSSPDSARDLRVDYVDLHRYQFVSTQAATFADYLRRYHRRPYTGMISLSAPYADTVMRYENLQEDFAAILQILNLEQVGPVPLINPTAGRDSDWQSYYSPDIIQLVKSSFGPFMTEWGYPFPEEWGAYREPWFKHAQYAFLKKATGLYLRHVRYSTTGPATVLRRLRALLLG